MNNKRIYNYNVCDDVRAYPSLSPSLSFVSVSIFVSVFYKNIGTTSLASSHRDALELEEMCIKREIVGQLRAVLITSALKTLIIFPRVTLYIPFRVLLKNSSFKSNFLNQL